MKKFLPIILITFIIALLLIFGAGTSKGQSNSLLRIHIRANSNLECDQTVKYLVKDEVVDYLTPFLAQATSKEKAESIIQSHLKDIENICNNVLSQKGFSYTAKAKLNNEYFPTRSYKDFVVDSGYYDALIVELGQAQGNNWWCVVYPPLCFTGDESKNGKNIVYKSRIMEIINKFYKTQGE